MSAALVIAEAGVNHNGDIETALKMVDAAADAGADFVKFQTFKVENVISRFAPKAPYQKATTSESESQLEMVRRYQLDADAHKRLMDRCRCKKISFLSSPFDLGSIDLLNDLGLEIFKIPSGEITNLPYLQKLGALRKKLILSTGMADLGEISDALEVLIYAGTDKQNITVLHCNTEYPTPFEDVNLSAMLTIRDRFDVKVGYSDHTPGIEVPIAAVALGACVIEKHFTLDRNMPGPDHQASIEPGELEAMIRAIRNIEKALGNCEKKPSGSELKNISIARKSIVAAKPIEKGELFTEQNITTKRPATGVSPMRWDEVIGQTATRAFGEDEVIEL